MKTWIKLILIFLVLGCENPVNEPKNVSFLNTEIQYTEMTEESETDNPINTNEPIKSTVKFGVILNNELKLYDYSECIKSYTGVIHYAENRTFSIDDKLCYLNEYGEITDITRLSFIPDKILIENNNIWMFEIIEPDEAVSLGGLHKYYYKMFKNGAEIGHWYDHQRELDRIFLSLNGDILGTDSLNRLFNITGNNDPWSCNDNLYIYDLNFDNKTAVFYTKNNVETVGYFTNYFLSGIWLQIEDTWYSSKGAIYKIGEGVTEEATSLFHFTNARNSNNETLNIKPVKYVDNISWWIEATCGELYTYDAVTDEYNKIKRLYMTDNTYGGGNVYYESVKPVFIDKYLYFNDYGRLKRYNPENNNIVEISDSGIMFEF